MSGQKEEAEKAPVEGMATQPPVARVERVADMRPWTWKRGITRRVVSAGVRAYVAAMFAMEAHMLRWVRGTPLGREVVPLVWRNMAVSSGAGERGARVAVSASGVVEDQKVSSATRASRAKTETLARSAASKTGPVVTFASTMTEWTFASAR